MEHMGWSWPDYVQLPVFHLDVLKHVLNKRRKDEAHQRLVQEAKQRRRGR